MAILRKKYHFSDMPSPEQESDPARKFIRDLEKVGNRLGRGRQVVKVAPPAGRYRRRPRGLFHATPELFLQTGGATDFECPGGNFRLEAGEVCVMPSGVPHAETPRDLHTPYSVLVCMHARDGFWLHRGKADPAHRIEGYGTRLVESVRGREAFRWLDALGESPDPDSALAGHLVGAVVSVFTSELQREGTSESIGGNPLVREAEKFVRTHLAEPELGVAWAARVLGCSSDHLARVFRRERGVGLGEWIALERMELARDLLRESRHQVAEVAWACGFATPSYFIRVFHRHCGMTPRAWRMESATTGSLIN